MGVSIKIVNYFKRKLLKKSPHIVSNFFYNAQIFQRRNLLKSIV